MKAKTPMHTLANILVGLVALLHMYFLVLEMFLWESGSGRKLSGFDAALARATVPLAANQGLYNGFLAAGLVWGLIAANPIGYSVQVFFLICVIVAGLYGTFTANRRILVAQALPGALALAAVILAG
jgi:putative membrane protein